MIMISRSLEEVVSCSVSRRKWQSAMIMVVAVVLPFSVTLDMAHEEEEDGDETMMMRETLSLFVAADSCMSNMLCRLDCGFMT